MEISEIIKSLRVCSTGGPESCGQCCLKYDCGCADKIMRAAADMLAADGSDMTITENGVEQIAKLNEKLDAILQGNQPQTAKKMDGSWTPRPQHHFGMHAIATLVDEMESGENGKH